MQLKRIAVLTINEDDLKSCILSHFRKTTNLKTYMLIQKYLNGEPCSFKYDRENKCLKVELFENMEEEI